MSEFMAYTDTEKVWTRYFDCLNTTGLDILRRNENNEDAICNAIGPTPNAPGYVFIVTNVLDLDNGIMHQITTALMAKGATDVNVEIDFGAGGFTVTVYYDLNENNATKKCQWCGPVYTVSKALLYPLFLYSCLVLINPSRYQMLL